MKKIKTINKLLSSLTLLSPLSGVGFNNQYQNIQKVLTENTKNYLNATENEQVEMGDITVNVQIDTEMGYKKITNYISGVGTLIVNDQINEIGSGAFVSGSNITSLDLSQATSLTTIGDSAFLWHKELTGNIKIPANVTKIGNRAFCETDITSIDLSEAENLTTIGYEAFGLCDFVNDFVATPKTNQNFSLATNLGDNAKVLIPGSTGIWDDNSVASGALAFGDVIIPGEVTKLNNYAFAETYITSLDFLHATNLISFGEKAIAAIPNVLNEFIFPSPVKEVPNMLFSDRVLSGVSRITNVKNLYFLSETPPKFNASEYDNWKPTLTGKIYVPSETAKQAYLSAENFGFSEEKVEITGIKGDFIINTKEKTSGLEQYTVIEGFSPTKWEIVMFEGDQPEWLTIDNQGLLSWTNQCVKGIYRFKIKASDDSQKSIESAPISLTVEKVNEEKSNIALILGLALGLGIPIILAVGFGVWYLTKKKKTTVKI